MENQTGMKEQDKEFVKAWYDPDTRGYRFYTKEGLEILMAGLNGKVVLNDNWGGKDCNIAIVEFLVEIVNQEPNGQSGDKEEGL